MNDTILSVAPHEPAYPELLKQAAGHPETLYVIGKLPEPCRTAIAIVGTRKASPEGLKLARTIARTLSSAGVSIISGLALGIDGAAHEGALEGGTPTFAVLGNGIGSIYPPAHETLAKRILENGGGLISEYPKDTPAFPAHFLERNRIVSGLSRAIVVIEAPARSGALSTARHAAEQGRDVFVLPGGASDQAYLGSHFLIREGARLVRNAADILLDLELEPAAPNPENPPHPLLLIIQKNPHGISVEKLGEISLFSPDELAASLTLLELEGTIHEQNGLFFAS